MWIDSELLSFHTDKINTLLLRFVSACCLKILDIV